MPRSIHMIIILDKSACFKDLEFYACWNFLMKAYPACAKDFIFFHIQLKNHKSFETSVIWLASKASGEVFGEQSDHPASRPLSHRSEHIENEIVVVSNSLPFPLT